jgi:hypothetical protein
MRFNLRRPSLALVKCQSLQEGHLYTSPSLPNLLSALAQLCCDSCRHLPLMGHQLLATIYRRAAECGTQD